MKFLDIAIEAVDNINLTTAELEECDCLVVSTAFGEVVIEVGDHTLFSTAEDDFDNNEDEDVKELTRTLIDRLEVYAMTLRNSAKIARKELLSRKRLAP